MQSEERPQSAFKLNELNRDIIPVADQFISFNPKNVTQMSGEADLAETRELIVNEVNKKKYKSMQDINVTAKNRTFVSNNE